MNVSRNVSLPSRLDSIDSKSNDLVNRTTITEVRVNHLTNQMTTMKSKLNCMEICSVEKQSDNIIT